MSHLVSCQSGNIRDNGYLIAGNLCNGFAIGDIGVEDDFWLVGSEPDGESSYPLLTGNFLDSEGNVLFRLVRNVLVINPGQCKKITGDLCGYEIHDSAGKLIFSIKTMFECPPGQKDKLYLTTIKGSFYNKQSKLVFSANSGEPDEHIETNNIKYCLGCPSAFVSGYTPEEMEFVNLVLATHGRIQRPLLGKIEKQEINLDGAALIGTELRECLIHVHSGNFATIRIPSFHSCQFFFHDDAQRLFQLFMTLQNQSWSQQPPPEIPPQRPTP
jgi:hypothetical protein